MTLIRTDENTGQANIVGMLHAGRLWLSVGQLEDLPHKDSYALATARWKAENVSGEVPEAGWVPGATQTKGVVAKVEEVVEEEDEDEEWEEDEDEEWEEDEEEWDEDEEKDEGYF